MRRASRRWTNDPRGALALSTIVGGIALIAGCGGDGGPSGPASYKDPVGSYSVTTVNSKTLPAAVYSDTGFLYELTSGTATLTSDGKYVNALTWRQTLPGSVSTFADTERGTWTLSGTAVRFTNAVDTTSNDEAEWANTGTLTFVEPHLGGGSDTLVYRIKK